MGYYSLLEIMRNNAKTEKNKETIKSILENVTGLSEEGIKIVFADEEEVDINDYALVITIDKNGNINLEYPDANAKWNYIDEVAALLSMIVDHGRIEMKFTGEDGALWAYKISKNKVFFSDEIVFRYRKTNKEFHRECIKSMKDCQLDEPLYIVNLTKKQIIPGFTLNDFDVKKKGYNILAHLLETTWHGDRVIVLGKFYKDNFNKITDTHYQRMIKEYKNISDSFPHQEYCYKNKYFINYTKGIEIDLSKEITVALLKDNSQPFFPFARIFALHQEEGEWVKNKVGIITK